MNIEALKAVRENFKMGYVLSFAEAMLIQQAIDAAIQSGNSAQPVTVPAGYVLVPVEPTPEMCDVGHIGIDVLTGVTIDSEYYSTWGDSAAKLYRAMLAAAPKAPDGWIPVSERMPDKAGFYLCWGTYFDGAEPDYIPASFFIHPTNGWSKWEPVEDDCDPNCVTITHWQPLPDAPKGV